MKKPTCVCIFLQKCDKRKKPYFKNYLVNLYPTFKSPCVVVLCLCQLSLHTELFQLPILFYIIYILPTPNIMTCATRHKIIQVRQYE